MIRIFFTGAKTYLAQQKKGVNSLGGFISSTPVPNDYLNGVFSKVSQSNRNEVRFFDMICLALRNDFDAPLKDLSFWVENESANPITSYEGSFVKPATSDNGVYFELVDTRKNKPIYAKFSNVLSEANKIKLEYQLEPKSYVGLWIKRNVLQVDSECTLEKDIETLETLKFNLEWV